MTLAQINPPGTGVQGEDIECDVIARGGDVCEGYCYPFAMLQNSTISADGVTVSIAPGDPGYIFGNIVGNTGASAADLRNARFVIALQSFLDTNRGRVKVKGICRAKVKRVDNTDITIGTELHVRQAVAPFATASHLDADAANSSNAPKFYAAYALENYLAASTPSGGTTMLVDFDGWNGIGSGANVT